MMYLDGVWTFEQKKAKFHFLTSPSLSELNSLLKTIAQRTIKLLEKRGLMIKDEGVEDRFLDLKANEPMNVRIGLKSCFTRAYSPESNGMSEAFVKTIKRDYVYVSDCYSAEVTMRMLGEWIKDYNTVAPHSGLGMRSPMEYRRLKGESKVCEVCPPLGGLRAGTRASQMKKKDVFHSQV